MTGWFAEFFIIYLAFKCGSLRDHNQIDCSVTVRLFFIVEHVRAHFVLVNTLEISNHEGRV